MPRKGQFQTHCKYGHARTPDNVYKTGSCKECSHIKSKLYRKNPSPEWKEKRSKQQQKWAKKNPTSILNTRLKGLYGIDFEKYSSTLEEQGNCCAICGDGFSDNIRPMVDHRHDTDKEWRGTFRALLCRK